MALTAQHKDSEFAIGDTVSVVQEVKEGDKTRKQSFEGIVISIKGKGENKSFTVRRIGAQKVGIERIFPLAAPTIEKVQVVRKGLRGTRRAKLYYTREQSQREIEKIYSRAKRREKSKAAKKTQKVQKT